MLKEVAQIEASVLALQIVMMFVPRGVVGKASPMTGGLLRLGFYPDVDAHLESQISNLGNNAESDNMNRFMISTKGKSVRTKSSLVQRSDTWCPFSASMTEVDDIFLGKGWPRCQAYLSHPISKTVCGCFTLLVDPSREI